MPLRALPDLVVDVTVAAGESDGVQAALVAFALDPHAPTIRNIVP